MVQLAQEVVLITGASSGIGAALAIALASQYRGIRLAIAARSVDKLEAVAATCRASGAEVLVVPTDMAETDQVKALAEKVLQHFGQVNILVNNAGYGQMGPIELVPTDAVRRQFEVNLLGTITLIQALIPAMRQQGGGRIVTVSSLGGRVAFPLGGLYSTSKFALEGLSDALRMELEPFNISVSVIEPGPVETEFFSSANQALEQNVAFENTPYQAALSRLESLNLRLKKQAWSAERTAEVIIKAMTASKPKPRYVAATGGKIMIWLMTKILPTQVVDLFWQRFYGIHLIKSDWLKSQRSA